MRIAHVVGVRPEFMQMEPVSREVRQVGEEILIHTGQHYDYEMSKAFFSELSLPEPDYHLGVGSGPHGVQTGRMLIEVEAVLLQERPDVVLVYGDTNSTLAGALAAAKLHISVGHVEAGLRSWNRQMPEELNRIAVDHLADYLFCPTHVAKENLVQEGLSERAIQVGDVMYDSILHYCGHSSQWPTTLTAMGMAEGPYYVATVHRVENTDDPLRLRGIFAALQELSKICPVFLPLHPRTREALQRHEVHITAPALHLVAPVPYLEMLRLQRHARTVLTDSGGIQKQAFLLGTSCITLRDETEWVETVEAGGNVLVGADCQRILNAAAGATDFTRPSLGKDSPYGSGDAAQRITAFLRGKAT